MSIESGRFRGKLSQSALWIAVSVVLLTGGLVACGDSNLFTGEPDPVGGPALVRRLTESQYRATIADIFGPDIPISARFERGLRSEGLLAIGTSNLQTGRPFTFSQRKMPDTTYAHYPSKL